MGAFDLPGKVLCVQEALERKAQGEVSGPQQGHPLRASRASWPRATVMFLMSCSLQASPVSLP